MILTRKSNRKDWNARATNNLIIFISTNQGVNEVFLAQSNYVRSVVSGVEVSVMPSSPTANWAEFIE
jgi:hypothetical protein